jgi:phage protein D
MAKAPFYKIYTAEKETDITEFISNFRFEDVVDEDNLLELRCNRANIEFIDNSELEVGKEIIFFYGFIGGKQSAKRIAKIKDFDTTYTDSIQHVIKCTDQGFVLKKRTSIIIYEEKTSSEIVAEIAQKFNFETEIIDTTTKYTIPQGGKTYYNFIKYLATKEGLKFYVRDNKIYFINRDLAKESKRVFTYGDPNGTVNRFRPQVKQKDGSSNTVGAFGMDTDTNSLLKFFSNDDNTSESGLGKKFVNYDANGNQLQVSDSDGGRHIVTPDNKQSEVKKKTESIKNDAMLDTMEAELVIELDPDIETEEIITIGGVAKKHEGNWYIKKVTNVITGSGGITTLDLKKNATNKTVSSQSGDVKKVNNTVGQKNPDQTTKVGLVYYDENGKEIKK